MSNSKKSVPDLNEALDHKDPIEAVQEAMARAMVKQETNYHSNSDDLLENTLVTPWPEIQDQLNMLEGIIGKFIEETDRRLSILELELQDIKKRKTVIFNHIV